MPNLNNDLRKKSFPWRSKTDAWKVLIDLNGDQAKETNEIIPLNDTINQVIELGLQAIKKQA